MSDRPGWRPSRPVAAPRASGPSSATAPAAAPAPSAQEVPVPLDGPVAPGAPRRPWRGPRPDRPPRPWRRLALSTVALLAATGLVAGLGLVQPRYGAAPPLGGTAVDDLRGAPVASGPGVDLAGTLAPGVPPECLRWTSTTVAPGLAVVRGAGAWSYGAANDGDCATAEATVGDRVGLLDLDGGRFRWVHDVADDLAATGAVRVDGADDVDVWADEGTGLVLLRVDDGERVVLVTLDRASGRVVERVDAGPLLPGARTLVDGRTVALASRAVGDEAWTFVLRDARALDRVAWTGTGTAEGTALALPDRLVVDRAGGAVQVDLAARAERAWGHRLDRLEDVHPHDGGLVALEAAAGPGAGPRVVSLAPDGTTRWAAPVGRRVAVVPVRDGVVVLDPRERTLTLLDGRGAASWSRTVPATSVATTLPGQRGGDVVVTTAPVRGGRLDVRALDGVTGAQRYAVGLPDDALLVAAGRTVGYALAFGVSGARSTLVAFDLDDGGVLWTHAAQLQVSVWAGRLVDVDVDGSLRVLADPSPVVAAP